MSGKTSRAKRKSGGVKKINLALQGGGAHGAFTWGVLDRLLEEDDIEIEGVSATSAGAMNGAMLTSGLKCGGPDEGRAEAKRRLSGLWTKVSEGFLPNALSKNPWASWMQAFTPLGGPFDLPRNQIYLAGTLMSQMISPYQTNLLGANPLREILEDLIDFDKVCRTDAPRLFVCATDVRSGRAQIFSGDDISIDAILASACLPDLYQAVEIDGREYWDGGYTGNPPIWPLIYETDIQDVMIVHINPIEREKTPHDALGIQNRVNEISFNSNLMAEMRAIHTIDQLVAHGHLSGERYKRMRIHSVEDEETMRRLSIATKLSPDSRLLETLRDAGRNAMEVWLQDNKDKIGVESSVEIREKYL